MSLAVLFKKVKPSQIGTIVLDATLRANHEMENDVTEFPVEDGAPITDHIWPKPRRFTIVGFITNSPVLFLGGKASGAYNASVSQGKLVTGPAINFVQVAFAQLEALHQARQLITIYTSLKTYTNMAIERITVDLDASTGDSLPFTMQVKEVRRVSSAVVAFVAPKPKSGKADKTAKTGKATPAPAAPKVEQGVTMAKQFINGISRLLSPAPVP